jgi:hypothetical protein
MKKILYTLSFLFISLMASAQDDLLNMLNSEQPKKPIPVFATFKATRLITMQSNETVARKHLNFVILHRFGEVNKGAYELWGMDQAFMRLAFDYGLTDNIQIGIGRSSPSKIYDGNVKWKIIKQASGGSPVGITYYGNIAFNTSEFSDKNIDNYFTSRLTYCNQILLTKKFNDAFSVLLAPSMVHKNLVTYNNDANTIFSVGVGASIKITRSTRFNIEYYSRLNGRDDFLDVAKTQRTYDYLGLGFDIETGGHVFQMMFCNATGMYEQAAIAQTTTTWSDMGIRLGFNLSRTFSMNSSKEKKW